MNKIKTYSCAICENLARKVKGEKRFAGTRKEVRKHLSEVHHIKGVKNFMNLKKSEFGQSEITKNTIAREFK